MALEGVHARYVRFLLSSTIYSLARWQTDHGEALHST